MESCITNSSTAKQEEKVKERGGCHPLGTFRNRPLQS